jgi:zinc D-Ala-D-Ala carboxypeptidase
VKLSNYVSLAEVTKSDTAKRKGIDNTPTAEHLENLKTICVEVFDKVREHFGVPIYISSGYRSAGLNKAIGGSKNSDHNLGRALDLDQDNRGNGVTNMEVFEFIVRTTLNSINAFLSSGLPRILTGFTWDTAREPTGNRYL